VRIHLKKVLKVLLFILLILIILPSVIFAANNFNYFGKGYIYWNTTKHWIGGAAIFANPNPDYVVQSQAANHTLWVNTNNTDTSWNEVGYSKGWYLNGRWDTTVRTLYYAWCYPDGTYYEYRSSYPVGSPGATHSYKIVYEYGAWRIYIDNTYQGGSTQPLYAKYIQVGLESFYHGNSCRVVYSSGLQVNEDGVWKGWSGNLSSIYQSPGYHFSWVTPLYSSNDWNEY